MTDLGVDPVLTDSPLSRTFVFALCSQLHSRKGSLEHDEGSGANICKVTGHDATDIPVLMAIVNQDTQNREFRSTRPLTRSDKWQQFRTGMWHFEQYTRPACLDIG